MASEIRQSRLGIERVELNNITERILKSQRNWGRNCYWAKKENLTIKEFQLIHRFYWV